MCWNTYKTYGYVPSSKYYPFVIYPACKERWLPFLLTLTPFLVGIKKYSLNMPKSVKLGIHIFLWILQGSPY